MTERTNKSVKSTAETAVYDFQPELSDEHWGLVADLFSNGRPSPKGGRPKVDPRACFEGILWLLRSGGRWKDMPPCFPSSTTCWRRFVQWTDSGILDKAWKRLIRKLDKEGKIDWKEGFADGTFSPAKKGAIT